MIQIGGQCVLVLPRAMGDWEDDDLEALLEAELYRNDSASSGGAGETRQATLFL